MGVSVAPFLEESLSEPGKEHKCFGLHRGWKEESGVSYSFIDLSVEEPRISLSRLVLRHRNEFFLKQLLELFFCGKKRYKEFLLGDEALL